MSRRFAQMTVALFALGVARLLLTDPMTLVWLTLIAVVNWEVVELLNEAVGTLVDQRAVRRSLS